MRTFKAGPLTVVAAGGSDREGRGDGPAIVLCHGYGAPGDDLVPFHRVIDAGPDVRWFFPAAPLALDAGWGVTGRAWWNIDIAALERAMMRGEERTMKDELPEGLAPAASQLAACLAHLQKEEGLEPSRAVLGGFSQGGMISTEIALMTDLRFAGLAILSGTLLCEDRWTAGAKEHASGLPVFQSHGQLDRLLPFSAATRLHEMLVAAGASVTFSPFRGQHEIPPHVAAGFGAFAKARLG